MWILGLKGLKDKGPYFMLVTLSTTDKHETDSMLIYPITPPPPAPSPSVSAPFKDYVKLHGKERSRNTREEPQNLSRRRLCTKPLY